MSNVVKAYQVNMESALKINKPISFHTIQQVEPENVPDKKESELLLESAKAEAESIIKDAQQTAKRLLEDARKEIEEMRIMVLEKAREQGFSEGHNEVIGQAEAILKEAEDIRENAQRDYQMLLENAETNIIQMVLEISKKIIGDEIETRPDKISSLVAQALVECRGSETVMIKVSPEDYDGVTENIDHIIRKSGYSGKYEVKKDLALQKGDCIVETPNGNIDASVQVQLEALEEALLSLID